MINVLAGANSSGKSSIIQSILLLKQTLQYGSENRPLTLNGPLLRLGTFEDVRNFLATDEDMEIGFDIELSNNEIEGPFSNPSTRALRRYRVGPNFKSSSYLSLNLSYGPKTEATGGLSLRIGGQPSLNPNLNRSGLTISFTMAAEDTEDRNIFLTRRSVVYQPPDEDDLTALWYRYSVGLDDASKTEVIGNRPKGSIIGVTPSYFLPAWLLVQFDGAEAKIRRTVDAICDLSTSLLASTKAKDELVPVAALHVINAWLSAHEADPIPLIQPIPHGIPCA